MSKEIKFLMFLNSNVGNREIAHYKQLLFFPVFSKDLYCRYVKMAGLVKGQNSQLFGKETVQQKVILLTIIKLITLLQFISQNMHSIASNIFSPFSESSEDMQDRRIEIKSLYT